MLADSEPTEPAVEAAANERGPWRRCLATGTVQPKAALLRFALTPDGALLADFGGRLPGRGLWIEPTAATLRRALDKRLFAKAAGRPVTVPPDLLERVQAEQRRRTLQRLGLARRAGLVTLGFEKVRAALAEGQVALLLAAADGADGGRGKLAALARGCALVDDFTAAELAASLGREHAVHVALAPGGLTEAFWADVQRLRGLQDGQLGSTGR